MATMTADPRRSTATARFAMTLAAIAATLGGWLAMARVEQATPTASGAEAGSARLPPLPSLEPRADTTRPARRPVPIATTRASR